MRSWDMRPPTLFLFAACLSSVWLMEWKALDEFVNLPDPHYEYTFLGKEEYYLYIIRINFHTINMTSQKWLDESEVDKSVWSHELTIVTKKGGKIKESCLLIIAPGHDDASSSSHFSSQLHLADLAFMSKSVIAVLRPVPVQPLTFYKHPLGRENIRGYDIMAYSWWRFLNDSAAPPHWLVQFPMVKATVRAMDTVTDFMMKTYRKNITQFTLTGISMGSWISWLTAAVDSRVTAIIPIGMDLLNFTENFHHQFRAYCGWSYMWRPFYEMNITQELDNPRFNDLAFHLDPLAYNERFTNISKYIILATGDELSMPDNSHYYFSQLEGEKNLNIIPNVDSRFQDEKTLFNPVLDFYYHIINNDPRPLVSWQRAMTNTTGIIYFKTLYGISPYNVFSYHADTVGGTRRDFRMKITAEHSYQSKPVKWIKSEVEHVKRDLYKKELEIPTKG